MISKKRALELYKQLQSFPSHVKRSEIVCGCGDAHLAIESVVTKITRKEEPLSEKLEEMLMAYVEPYMTLFRKDINAKDSTVTKRIKKYYKNTFITAATTGKVVLIKQFRSFIDEEGFTDLDYTKQETLTYHIDLDKLEIGYFGCSSSRIEESNFIGDIETIVNNIQPFLNERPEVFYDAKPKIQQI